MGKITLDPQLKEKLNGLNEQLEVCDEMGKTVGHFLPAALYRDLVRAWARAEFSDAEIEQARQELRKEGGLTTAEAIALLQETAKQGAKGKA